MEQLYIADADGLNPLHLYGTLVSPPVVGARRDEIPRLLPDGRIEESIEIVLQGDGIREMLHSLEARIANSQDRLIDAYLYLKTAEGVSPLSARIQSGRIELLGGGLQDRRRNLQILRLSILRADHWEEPNQALRLSNQNGTDVWDGLTIRNHCDATSGHQNFADVNPDEVGGTQPCPAQVRLILPAGFPSTLQGCFIAAGFDLRTAYSSFDHVLEGEDGLPGSGCTASSQLVDATCSGGYSARVEWSSQGETPIWKWALGAAQLTFMKSRLFRPLMRLATLPAEGIYLRWSAPNHSGAGEMLRTQPVRLDAVHCLAPLPALRLPPDWMGGGPYEPLEIQLLAECAAAGTKTLNIDFVHLLPGSSFQHLQPLGGLGAGFTLVSDGQERRVYACQTSGGSQHVSHALTGSPILLHPGRENRIYCLYETLAGAPVDSQVQLMVYRRARVQQP